MQTGLTNKVKLDIGSVGITLTSAPSLRRPTPKEEDVAAASAAAAEAAVAAARSRERTTPRRARTPDGAREVSGTREKVNLAVRTSLHGEKPAAEYAWQ